MALRRDIRAVPRDVWILLLATLVNRAGTMVLPFLLLFLTRERGFTASHAAVILALYGATAIVAAPLSGRLCDRLGALPVMRASLLGSGLLLLCFPFVRPPLAVAALTVAWAAVAELFRPASLAILSDLAVPEQRRLVFALNRLAINLGMSVGPAAGGFLATVSYPTLFVLDGVTSLASAAILFRVAGPGRRTEGADAGPGEGGSPLGDRRLLLLLLATVPVALVFFQHVSAFALFLVRDLRLPESAYGLLFTLNTLIIVAVEVPLNAAMARWPHGRALALGAVLTGIGFGLLAFVRDLPAVAATVVVWTFGEMILFPSLSAAVADLAPAARRGAYMGLYMTTFNLAFAVGPWAGAVVLDTLGGTVLWGGAFVAGLVSAAGFLAGPKAPPSPEPVG